MKKLNMTKQEKKEIVGKLIEPMSKALILTMKILDLKNHIEMISEFEGVEYRLRFEKYKGNNEVIDVLNNLKKQNKRLDDVGYGYDKALDDAIDKIITY